MSKGKQMAGWDLKKISDVAAVFDGPHATPKTVDSGPIFLGIDALQDGTINLGKTRHVTAEDFQQWTRRVRPRPNDVVFSYETKLGEAAIIPPGLDCCLGRRMGLVRFDEKRIIPRFFLYQYISPPFRDFLGDRTIRGATVDRISIKEFPSFPITVPPVPEQRRIVGVLDKAFDAIAIAKANAEKNLQNARALFESYLQSVLASGGRGWGEKPLGEIAESISTGPFGTMLHKSDYVSDGVPLVNPMNIVDSRIVPSNRMMVDEQTRHRLSAYVLKAGDIVIARRGELGRCAIVTRKEEGWLCGTGSFFLRLSKHVDAKFFLSVFSSKPVRARLESNSIGATMSNLNHAILKDLPIVLPLLEQQRSITAKGEDLLQRARRLEALYRQKLAALDALKQSLLHQAFTGAL